MLNKREKHLQHQMDEEDAKARKFVNTNKTGTCSPFPSNRCSIVPRADDDTHMPYLTNVILTLNFLTAAKAALRKKKQLENTLEQTSAQIMNLEGQIQSIETANINKETLDALKNASTALKGIHGGLTIDKVDATMEDLEEQHAISKEIAGALTQGAGANAVDDTELEAELADLQQEELDNQMLKTGSVPVSDQVHRLPAAAQGESEYSHLPARAPCGQGLVIDCMLTAYQQSKAKRRNGWKKTTRKKSCASCRQRWPCELEVQFFPHRWTGDTSWTVEFKTYPLFLSPPRRCRFSCAELLHL